jgi:hypothetical protein
VRCPAKYSTGTAAATTIATMSETRALTALTVLDYLLDEVRATAGLLRVADLIREVKRQIGSLQRQAGNWHVGWTARAPMEDGDFSRTAMAIRALQIYGSAGRKQELQKRI